MSMGQYRRTCLALTESMKNQAELCDSVRDELRERMRWVQRSRAIFMIRACFTKGLMADGTDTDIPTVLKCEFAEKIEPLSLSDGTSSLDELYKKVDDLIPILSRVSEEALDEDVTFYDKKISVRTILAYSTLPAIFEHCWSYEQRINYIHFLVELARARKDHGIELTRDSLIFDCVQNFILSSGIGQFLHLALEPVLMKMIQTDRLAQEDISGFAVECVRGMLDYVRAIPNEVKILLKKCALELTDHGAQSIGQLVVEWIIGPVSEWPKLYGALPTTFQTERALLLTSLPGMLKGGAIGDEGKRWLDKLSTAISDGVIEVTIGGQEERYDTQDNGREKYVVCPSETKMRKLLGEAGKKVLLNMWDVELLFELCKHRAGPIRTFQTRCMYVNDDNILRFYEYELTQVGDGRDMERKRPRRAQGTLAAVGRAMYSFLAYVRGDPNEPAALPDFLNRYRKAAVLTHDMKLATYWNCLVLKLRELKGDQYDNILSELDAEIAWQRAIRDDNDAVLAGMSHANTILNSEIQKFTKRDAAIHSIAASHIVGWFVQREKRELAKESILNRAKELLDEPSAFVQFFVGMVDKLKVYVEQFQGFTVQDVAIHLHCWITQVLTVSTYMKCHPGFENADDKILGVSSEQVNEVCVLPAPVKVQEILRCEHVLQFVKTELHAAGEQTSAIAMVERIATAVRLIQRTCEVTLGSSPQADEMTPIFNFSLLKSGLEHMYSIERYLAHFLQDVSIPSVKLLDESSAVSLIHFINHVSSLHEVVH